MRLIWTSLAFSFSSRTVFKCKTFFYFQDPSSHHKIPQVDLWTDLDFLLGQMFLPGAKNFNANRPYEVWKFHFYPTKSAPVSRNHDFVLIMLTKIFVKALAVYGAHKKWMDEILLAFGQILTSFIQNKNLICLNSTALFVSIRVTLRRPRPNVFLPKTSMAQIV